MTDKVLSAYKTQMGMVEKLISKTEAMLRSLSNLANSQKEKGVVKKLETALQEKSEDFQSRKAELERLLRDKKLDRRVQNIPEKNNSSSVVSSVDVDDQMMSDLPVLQVYDQEKFVNERHDKVKKIKSDARDINTLAVQIN